MKKIAKESKKLTKILKQMFGDVVKSGYIIATLYTVDSNPELELQKIENSMPVPITDEGDLYFDWSLVEFAMKLTNGKFVRMGNSEWAHMSTHENLEDAVNDY